MDVAAEDQALQAVLGRGDFGGIDNEALDFSQLEDYINDDGDSNIYFHEALVSGDIKLIGGGGPGNGDAQQATQQHISVKNGLAPGLTVGAVSPVLSAQKPQQTQQTASTLSPAPTNVTSVDIHTVGSPTVSTTVDLGGFQPITGPASVYQPTHHLPDSPPDSGSEPPFSPHNDDLKVVGRSHPSEAMLHQQGDHSLKHFMTFGNIQPLKHLSDNGISLANPHPHSPSSSSSQLSGRETSGTQSQILTQLSQPVLQVAIQSSVPPHPPRPPPLVIPSSQTAKTAIVSPNHLNSLYSNEVTLCNKDDYLCDSLSNPSSSSSNPTKKRKLSDSPKGNVPLSLLNGLVHIKQEPAGGGLSPEPSSNILVQSEEDYNFDFNNPEASMFMDSVYQCIKFQPFQQNTWSTLCDQSLKELPLPNYRVDADKGFNFSNADEAFVCQKKNHFQVTVHVQVLSDPVYVKSPDGVKEVENFYLHFHGVKVESPSQLIKIEQSQSDRSKKPFHPVLVDLSNDQISKTTVGRLHFSETTSNNMRKKGKPNPDQRYFQLVVGLYAHVGDQTYPIIAQSSERIIVRASNPGQFENDMELSWQKGHTQDSIFHAGRVGINTDRPDESLVIHGNVRVTGHIVQPSDERAKTNVVEVDSKEQLKNVANMKIVHYDYRPEFAQQVGLHVDELRATGVLAQDVQKILPDAVRDAGDVVLADGNTIENFLVVNKERIFMENVGAVKELCKVTDNLETRIDELERMNRKLAKLKRLDSLKSTCSGSTVTSVSNGSIHRHQSRSCSWGTGSDRQGHHYHHGHHYGKHHCRKEDPLFCSNRLVQGTIVTLVLIMAFCLAAVATLYILEWQKRHSSIPESIMLDTKIGPRGTVPPQATQSHPSSGFQPYYTETVQGINRPDSKGTSLDSSKVLHQNPGSKESNLPTNFPAWTQEGHLPSSGTANPPPIGRVYYATDPGIQPPLRPIPTALPILKPYILGAPAECRGIAPSTESCTVSCCTSSSSGVQGDMLIPEQQHDTMEATHENEEDTVKNVSSSREGYSGRTGLEGRSLNLSVIAPQVLSGEQHPGSQDHRDSTSKATSEEETGTRSPMGHPLSEFDNLNPDRGVIEDVHDNSALGGSKISKTDGAFDPDHANSSRDGTVSGSQSPERQRHRRQLYETKLKVHRTRRSRDSSASSRSQLSKIQTRKEFSRLVQSLQLVELNASIGVEYCNNLPCINGAGPNFSYHVPISKYMPLDYVTLLFNFEAPLIIDHCEPKDKTLACQNSQNVPHMYNTQNTQNLVEEINSHWRLPIGLYLRSSYRFRIMSRNVIDTPCSLPDSDIGRNFIEYNLVFQRKCDK